MGKRGMLIAAIAGVLSAIAVVLCLGATRSRRKTNKRRREIALDGALADTFPASDPVAVFVD